MNPVHFSSENQDWSTPQDFFDKVAAEYGPFDLDACATPANAKCPKFYTFVENGLLQPWEGKVWCNPPYGRGVGEWVRKGLKSAREGGALVVMLLPARTDTAWWHDYVMKGSVRFIRGRLTFGGAEHPAPFPCALVVFRPHAKGKLTITKRAA